MIASHSLKLTLPWAQSHVKKLNANMASAVELWNEVGERLWDQATRGDKTTAGFLPLWRAALETLKVQEGARKGLSCTASSATGEDSAKELLTFPFCLRTEIDRAAVRRRTVAQQSRPL